MWKSIVDIMLDLLVFLVGVSVLAEVCNRMLLGWLPHAARISAMDSSGLLCGSLSAISSWQGVGYRVPIEGVGGIVQGTFHPLSSVIVGHDFALKALEAWVLDFVEPVVVKDWYKRVVISDNGKVWETYEKQLALDDGP